MTDFDSLNDIYTSRRKTLLAANAANKGAVFDALAAANITAVSVEFDGEGDSGQINDITALAGPDSVDLPITQLQFQQATWNSDELTISPTSLRDAIDALCYDFLDFEHGGWENNEGGYGTFHFDTSKRSIHLDFNARFSDYVNHVHEC